QAAIRMNELAAHINSEADARAFVDAVADMFADNLPPAWATRGIRERIARAEYEAVSDPLRQIPEQRIADVWNKYVREIGASEEPIVRPRARNRSLRPHHLPGRNIRQSTRRTRTIAEVLCRFRCHQEESGKYEGQPENQCLAGSADRRQSALIRYVRAHGVEHFKQLVEPLFEELFPASHQASSKSP